MTPHILNSEDLDLETAIWIKETLWDALNYREWAVLDMRMDRMTLAEIGLVLGVTRERVREIQAKCYMKIKFHVKYSGTLFMGPMCQWRSRYRHMRWPRMVA